MRVFPTTRLKLILEEETKMVLNSLNSTTESVKKESRAFGFGSKNVTHRKETKAQFGCWTYSKGRICASLLVEGYVDGVPTNGLWDGYADYYLAYKVDVFPLTLQQFLFLKEDLEPYESTLHYKGLVAFYGTIQDVEELQRAPLGLFVESK